MTKFNAAGSNLVYSTYLGGSAAEGGLYGGLLLTPTGEVYVSGFTDSVDFPVTSDAYDPYFNGERDFCIAKLDASGQLVAATYLGGRGREGWGGGCDIALDAEGNFWCSGGAASDNFPTTRGAYNWRLGSIDFRDIFLAGLTSDLRTVKYSTVLGGAAVEDTFVLADPWSSSLYVWAGVDVFGGHPEFPRTPGAFDTEYNGSRDGYLVKIDPTVNMGSSDADIMPDWWELLYSLDPYKDDGAEDPDGDGLSNQEEYLQNRNPRSPQNKYRLGPATDLLNEAFYVGEASDGSNVAGRWALFGRAASDNQTVVFWALNVATNQSALFLVDIGDPSSWRRLTVDVGGGLGPLCWTPDDSYVITSGYRIPVASGSLEPHTVFGYPIPSNGVAITRTAEDNWLALSPQGDLLFLPILNDGSEDVSRESELVQVTDMAKNLVMATWHDIPKDGEMIAFYPYLGTTPGPTDTDIYAIRNVTEIRTAPKREGTIISSLAPESLSDPNVVPLRASETSNTALWPFFSEDGSVVIYSEEASGLVRRDTDVLSVAFQSEWDVVISNADGSGEDYVLAEPGNQAMAIPTPGGMRLLYLQEVGNEIHLMVSTLEVRQEMAGTPVGPPEDNVITTVAEQTVSDASGTTLEIPAGTTIDFPPDVPQTIQISTPIDPASEPQLPPYVEAIAVIREFGPEGTTFSQPIPVTISYTDAEIEGLDEGTLRVFEFNPATGMYDTEVTTIVNRDLANNTITFTVTHFSIYGLGNGTPFGFTGFLDPIGGADATGGSFSDPVRTFKFRSVIPVKFTATDQNGPLLTGIHTLQAIKFSSVTDSEPPIDATPTGAATTGNQFLMVDGEWQFNLSTKGLSKGTWLLSAHLSDGSVHTAWICIK
mgnify:FL=1